MGWCLFKPRKLSKGGSKGLPREGRVASLSFVLHRTLFAEPHVFAWMDFLGDQWDAIKSKGAWTH